MKYLLSLVIGAFTFLFPHHQPVPAAVQPVVTAASTTVITVQAQTEPPAKPVSHAKDKTVVKTASVAPVIAPIVTVPVVTPAATPVPVKNPITVPPDLSKPHPSTSVSINTVKIKNLQDQYDTDTANIKKIQDYVAKACQPLLTASPVVQGNAAIALQASAEECQSAEDSVKLQTSIYQSDQASLQAQIDALKSDPIQ